MRRPLPFVVVLALTYAPLHLAQAAAPEPTLFGRRVTARNPLSEAEVAQRREAFERHLADNDLSLEGDVLMTGAQARGELTDDQRAMAATGWEDPPHNATIFLNFFGGTLRYGTIAAEMQAGCISGGAVDYPGFAGTQSMALAIIQVFQTAMEPYGVRIAYEEAPPAHLPYSMVMMGGTPQDIGVDPGALGVSCSTDCGDQWWRDTTFAFTETSSDALTLGNTALQEAAHALGLDHIDGSNHIMYPVATPGQKVWADTCTAYRKSPNGTGTSCTYVHDVFCGEDAGMQNSAAELMAFFGPNEPDIEAPTVSLTSPADGDEFAPGSDITIAVDVSDDHEGFGWRLHISGGDGVDEIVNAYQFEKEWKLSLPAGTYTIAVDAIDHDGNEGSDEVTVYVGTDAPTTGGDTGGSTSDGNATAGSGDATAGSDSVGENSDTGSSHTPSSGCMVVAPAGSTGGLAALLLGVAGLRRRRRT